MKYQGSCHCGQVKLAVEGTHLFNQHKIKHRFCPTCGIHVYGETAAPSGEMMAAINIRCIEGIDLESVPVKHFDGRAL